MRAPSSGWRFTISYSSSVSRSGFVRIASGTPIFPMSWKRPAKCSTSICFGPSPSSRPRATAIRRPRARAHEKRKGPRESNNPAPDGKPEHGATRADQAVERSRVGVDLIGPDCACAVPVLDRRIDLEQLPVAEFVALERVLAVGAGSDECRDRLVLADRLAELVVERETMIDQMPIAIRREPAGARPGARVRPGEDAVPPPDLHRGDVALPQNAAGKLTVLLPGDVNAPVANE